MDDKYIAIRQAKLLYFYQEYLLGILVNSRITPHLNTYHHKEQIQGKN